ncbi:protein neprosin [Cryptomeria japonica]|uniref:protein neprosin n=1 Tax=Cryptomeria japonica TaxID=3369 RepID=UPI0027D9EAAC|nr:protein neprosin [Cryptomeria japonica]
MASRMLQLVFICVLCVPFMILVSPAELGIMSILDYISYINPPAVHKYKHDNGDNILCVKFTDQISLQRGKQQYGYDKKNSIIGWRDAQAGDSIKRCPEGTVSVMEIKPDHQYAVMKYLYEGVYGAQGIFNVWQPYVESHDYFSLSQIWLIRDKGLPTMQTMEAGWIVYPSYYGDSRPRLFVYWTADNYNKTGCWNLYCEGFVMSTDSKYYPGQPIEPVSEYEGPQIEREISIKRLSDSFDREFLQGEGVWYLYIQNERVGYWPGSLFDSLAESADRVEYGGEVAIYGDNAGTPHSRTHMGSGHFLEEGWSRAAYIRNIEIHNSNGTLVYPPETNGVTNSKCYNLATHANQTWGQYMFFGGPGGDNPSCVN